VAAAIGEGAKSITLCDTAGVLLPDEFGAFVKDVIENVEGMANVELYVQPSDAMDMAAACAAAAIANGASGVKCTATACGYPTLEQMNRFAQIKGAAMDFCVNLRATELSRAVNQLNWLMEPPRSELTPFDNAISGDIASVTLDDNDDIGEVIKVVRQLGYDLSEEDNAKVFEAFKRVAAKKHFVGTRELDAIVASTALQVPSTYRLESYVINSGNNIRATARIAILKDGVLMESVAVGDGPIDAAFMAIDEIVGKHFELDDFQIQAVTEGREAMGQTVVKLRSGGKVYSGRGISTDIVGAGIRAYINALNKIVYEEDNA
jgi:2-isopropylmalate synthase